jgi:general secretion pathway protein L
VLELLDELTRILPDDTWITRLDIKGSELEIQGQSASAAALIPLIESSSILQNPRFRSPVTQIPRSDVERFHLSAETRGPTP